MNPERPRLYPENLKSQIVLDITMCNPEGLKTTMERYNFHEVVNNPKLRNDIETSIRALREKLNANEIAVNSTEKGVLDKLEIRKIRLTLAVCDQLLATTPESFPEA